MSDQAKLPESSDLTARLSDVAARIVFPPTPDVAPRVREALLARTQRDGSGARERLRLVSLRWRGGPRLRLLIAAAVLLIVVAVTALLPETRSALAGRLGVRGIGVTHIEAVPPLSPVPATSGATLGSNLRLGDRMTLADAERRAAFHVLLPGSPLDQPDAAYFGEPPVGGQVSLVYAPRASLPSTSTTGVGLLLSEFRGDLATDMVAAKGLGPGTRLESVTVNGRDGLWIEGEAHLFFYHDARGDLRPEGVRLAGNTLLWEQNGLTLRLESALSRDEALRVAASLR